MTTEKLKVGLAGLGVVGKRRRELIDRHENLSLVAVCDKSPCENSGKRSTVKVFTNLDDLLKEDIDILFVCLSNDKAAEVTTAGLENGFHVFCEKPPGRNLDEIAQVRCVEKRKKGLKLMYGFNHRHHESIEDALKYVTSNSSGRLINIKGTYGKSQLVGNESDWRAKRISAGGGILLDQGIHMVDLFRLFAGDFTQIHSFISDDYWHHDVEDNAYALMKSETGVVAFLHSSATQWAHTFNIELIFDASSLVLSGILSGSMSYAPETMSVIHRQNIGHDSPKDVYKTYDTDDSWWKEICIFTDAILTDKAISSGSSLDAYKTMELVYKIYTADSEWKNKYDL